MLIFVDDDLENRKTPNGFIRFTTGEDLISFIKNNQEPIHVLSLDNDLGLGIMEGYDILKELIAMGIKIYCLNIHSANIIAQRNMISYMKSAIKVGVYPKDTTICQYSASEIGRIFKND